MKRPGSIALCVLLLVLVPAAGAEVRELPLGSFAFELEVVVPGTPEAVYDAFTSETLEWWDHHHSKEPRKLEFEARPGGRFVEIFDDAGNGAEHARVIYADRGKLLRFVGPLGLTGKAIEMVHSLTFEPAEGGTRLKLDVRAVGEVEENIGSVVESVWKHFLIERFEPYMRGKQAKG